MRAQISNILLFLYILSIGFQRLFEFPVLGDKIQLPEIIFIFLFLFSLPSVVNGVKSLRSSLFNLGICLYFLAVLISCIYNFNEAGVWFELMGLAYLIILFFTSFSIIKSKSLDTLNKINTWFVYSGLIAGILGIFGFVISSFGITSELAWSSSRYYPYFGHVARAEGFTASANMLLSILSIPILYLVWKYRQRNISFLERWVLLILMIATILTFSKMLLGLFICILILISSQNMQWKPYCWIASIILFIALFLGTHFMIVKHNTLEKEEFKKEAYIIEDPIWQNEQITIYPTNYAINKSISLTAGLSHPITGIGPGQQNRFVSNLKSQGKLPANYGNYDPHSTFFGAFGELGLFGLSAILFLFLVIMKTIRNIYLEHRDIGYLFIAIFTFALIDAISLDIMNFRHYWVYLAVVYVSHLSLTKSIKAP